MKFEEESDEIERLNKRTDELLARTKKLNQRSRDMATLIIRQLLIETCNQFLNSLETFVKMQELIDKTAEGFK